MRKLVIKKKWYDKLYRKDIVFVDASTSWDFDFKGLNYECDGLYYDNSNN